MTDEVAPQKILSLDDILKADDREVRYVEVPEWNGSVRLRALKGDRRDHYLRKLLKTPGGKDELTPERTQVIIDVRVPLVAEHMVDEDDKPLCPDEKSIKALYQKNGSVIDRLFPICLELSKFNPEATNDAVGESGPTPGDGSS